MGEFELTVTSGEDLTAAEETALQQHLEKLFDIDSDEFAEFSKRVGDQLQEKTGSSETGITGVSTPTVSGGNAQNKATTTDTDSFASGKQGLALAVAMVMVLQ